MAGNLLWWKGPPRLTNQSEWPRDIVTTAIHESEAEAKATRAVFKLAVEPTNPSGEILTKFSLAQQSCKSKRMDFSICV